MHLTWSLKDVPCFHPGCYDFIAVYSTCDVECWVTWWLDILRYRISHLLDHGHGMMIFHFVYIIKNTTPWALHPRDYYSLDGGCYIVGWFDTMQMWDITTSILNNMFSNLNFGPFYDDVIYQGLMTLWLVATSTPHDGLRCDKALDDDIPACFHWWMMTCGLGRLPWPVGGLMSPLCDLMMYCLHLLPL